MSSDQSKSYVAHMTALARQMPSSRYLCLNHSPYLKQLLLSLIKNRLAKNDKTPPESYIFYAKDLDWNDWLDKTESTSFFSSQKLVLMKNCFQLDKKKLKFLLDTPISPEAEEINTVIVLEDDINLKDAGSLAHKAIEAGWMVLDDISMSKKQWLARIQKRFEWYQLHPPAEFLEKLMQQTMMDIDIAIDQTDRWGLTYSGKKDVPWDKLSMDHIPLVQSVIFDLSDALLSRNYPKSLGTYFHLLDQGKSPEEILYFLLNHCILLGQVKTVAEHANNSAELAKAFKDINAYRLKKLIQQASKSSRERIMDAIELLLYADKQYKTQSDVSLDTLMVTAIGSI